MAKMTMCGYDCTLCQAFVLNIEKDDKRETLSAMWMKYYDLDIPADSIYCDGCRCDKPDAKRIDICCPIRACVMDKGIEHCGDCDNYPCALFAQRVGLSMAEVKRQQGDCFDANEYDEYLRAYDNKTRLDAYVSRAE